MTYKISGMFFILWAALAFFSATAMLESDFADGGVSSEAFSDLVDATGNPQSLTLDNPTLGGSGVPLVGQIPIIGDAIGWIVFISKAALLQSPIWEGWTAPFRVLIIVLTGKAFFAWINRSIKIDRSI